MDQGRTGRQSGGTDRPWSALVGAVVAVAAAGLLRWLFDPFLGDHLPFVTFFVAVAVAAWFGGLRPALLATVLGFFAAWFFFVPPRFVFPGVEGPHLFGLLMYLMVCFAFIGFGEAIQIASRRMVEQGERLRTTLASIGDAVITTDTEGRVTNLNAVAESLTGWRNADAVGQPLDAVFRIVNEETRRPVENPATRALREGVIVGLANHTVLIAKDGTERPIDDSAAPIRCKENEIVGCVLVFRDVTERRRAEEELRFQLALTRSITDNATTAIFLMDDQSRCTFMNPAAETMTGFTFEEVRGGILHDFIHHHHPDGRPYPMPECPIDRALPEQFDVVGHEDVFIRKNGEFFPVQVNAKPIRKESKAIGTVIEVRDTTKEREAAAALRESEAHFRSMADNAPVMLWVTNPTGSCTYLSSQWYEFTGRRAGGDVGFGWLEAVHPDDVVRAKGVFLAANERRLPFALDYRVRRHDGEYRWVIDAALPRIVVGVFQGYVGCVFDVHERKQLEEELRHVAADLSEAHRRKDEFLATLAHELRNPLAPIRNGLEVMKLAGNDSGAVDNARSMMERQLEQMVRLVDDLMDVSRISRGKIELKKQWVALAVVVSSAVETSRPLIDQMGHELTVTLPRQPVIVDADLTRLAQVFMNLLNNAAKYSERGGHIWLTVERQGSDVVVSVRDTGIGIEAAHLPRIFDLFSQVERSLEKAQGGLGIGLSLVKRLVELHDGRIEARSEGPGRGAEFVVRLPVVVEASVPKADEPTASPKSAFRILIVDDNKDGADSLGMMLKILGNDTRTAYDGQEGVEQAERYRPDVALLDIGLPKLNGYEACRRIREQPWGKNMVLIAVTGWGQDDDRRRSHESGFDHHMVKPVDPGELARLLAGLRAARA